MNYPPPREITRKDIQLSGKSMAEMQEQLAEFGLVLGEPPAPGAVCVTNCCAEKGNLPTGWGTPEQMYVSGRVKRFVANMGDVNFGIISDLYGLCIRGRLIKSYELHPSALTNEHLWQVGAKVRATCRSNKIPALHYVSSPPTTMVPYLIILLASGVPFTAATKLPTS